MDIHSYRRSRLQELVDKEAGGVAAEFARKHNQDATRIRQLLSATYRDGRGFGEGAARNFEEALGLPHLYFDLGFENALSAQHESSAANASISTRNPGKITKSPPDAVANMMNDPAASHGSKNTDGRASVSARPILAWDREEELGDEYVLIPRLDVKFSAGNGKIVWHIDEKGQKQAFRRAWCQRLGINPDHAATIVNEGQSMESRIQDGDSLVVDYKATRIIDGKVYALAYRGELYVKRLFKLPSGGLIVRSDNPDKARFPDINLTPEEMEFVEIVAQVKGVSGGV